MSLFDSSNKGIKFQNVGDQITGTIAGAPSERQQTKFGTQDPDFWPNGDPKMQIIVPLQTELREDGQDDGERTLYVASKHMKRAISDAIRTAGATDILPGGVLTVQYVGNDANSKNPANPAKMYAASYTAPSSAFAAPAPVAQQPFVPATPAPVAQPAFVPAAVPATPAPQVAPAPAAPVQQWLNEQQVAQLTQLRAAGIPEVTIATALGATPEQIAGYDAQPF